MSFSDIATPAAGDRPWTATGAAILTALNSVAQGAIGTSSNTSQVTGVAGTETVTDSITFTAIAGRRYRLTWTGVWFATAGDQYYFRMRYLAGASLTASGTQFRQVLVGVAATSNRTPGFLVGEATGIAAGQTTIGLTFHRASGSAGTLTRDGAADCASLLFLDDVGK